jgi:co-chaperonin GroES (HSP10)
MMTILNESGLEPSGRAILCIPYMPELTESVITLTDQVMALELMREMRGTVIELGEDAYKGASPRCKPGDNVLISKFCGVIVKGPLDNKFYRLINDEDVFCRLKGDISKVMIKNPIAQSKQQGGEARTKATILQGRS